MTCWVPMLSWALMISGPMPDEYKWLLDPWPRLQHCFATQEACADAADAVNAAFDMEKSLERHASCEYRPPPR
jgi:hypothetical protein